MYKSEQKLSFKLFWDTVKTEEYSYGKKYS